MPIFLQRLSLPNSTFFVLLFMLLLVGAQLIQIPTAQAVATTSESTHAFSLMKKFSDVYPAGYTADRFKFLIEGTSASGTVIDQTVDLTHYSNDTAKATVDLPLGDYTITEIAPSSFYPGEWTVQWSGYGCQNANGPALFTTMTVSGDTTADTCRADNQWRPGKLTVEKVFVGTSTAPENFNFTVKQGSEVRYDGPFDTDGINSNIFISRGDYTVVEADHPDYTATYSADCTGTMAQGGSALCTITNTHNGTGGNGGNGNNDTTGVLVVKKLFVGTTTVPYEDFSFTYTGATGSTTFNSNGENNLVVTTGNYSIAETAAAGYSTTYDNCTDVKVVANATSTCTITNTLKNGDGGSGTGDDNYRLQGYVWHDVNENGIFDDTEDPLPNWTVHLSGSSTDRSTVTDTNGFYSFLVDEGTWTLSETVKSNWEQTSPTTTTYVVTVPEQEDDHLTLMFPLNYLFKVAQAATTEVSGDFNFGNVFRGGRGGGYDNDRGRTTGTKIGHSTSNNEPALDTPDPTPQVLGEQVSVVPQGGANAGAGGTATEHYPLPLLFLFVLLLFVSFAQSRSSN